MQVDLREPRSKERKLSARMQISTSLCAPKSFGGSPFLPGEGMVGEGCQVSGRINSTASNGDPCPGPGNLRQAVHSRSRERRLTKINTSQAFLCGDVGDIIIIFHFTTGNRFGGVKEFAQVCTGPVRGGAQMGHP